MEKNVIKCISIITYYNNISQNEFMHLLFHITKYILSAES